LLVFACAAFADEANTEDMVKTIKALQAQVKQQAERLNELEAKAARQQESWAKIAKEIADDAGKRPDVPGWLDNLKFYGDLRLRYQGECFSGRPEGDSEKKRNRLRFRLRFGIKKTWLDEQLEVGFRLASGSCPAANSTNQSFDDHFTEKPVWIDLAYAKYRPNWLKGLTVIGGKMENPLVHTDLIWDSDVNPEGLWVQYAHAFNSFEPFANVGYWILDENYYSPTGIDTDPHTLRDVILFTYQVGFHWAITKDIKWTCAGTYYDYDHYDVSFWDDGGNHEVDGRLMARQFHMINFTNKVGFKLLDLPWKAYFDIVCNCGEQDRDTDYDDQGVGYAVGLKVGKNKKKGDWSVGYKYAYIEANCTPGAFNDSDFGGTNRKGHVWSGVYNLTDFLTVGARVFWTEPVTGPHDDERDVLTQVDLVWSF